MQADWSNTIAGDLDCKKLYSCHHVNAVISWVSHKAIPRLQLPDENSSSYKEEIAMLFTEKLVNSPSRAIKPGSWILQEVHYPFKSGRLLFYLSEHEGIFTFCQTKSTSGRSYLYCFLCPRSRTCTHISFTPPIDINGIEESDVPLRETNMAPAQSEVEDTLVSKDRYPFDLDSDEHLRDVIKERMYRPVLEWFNENYDDGYFKSETRTCCDEPCEYFPTSNRNAELFSLHGYAQARTILASRCGVCNTRYDFDGRSCGILNYGNRYLFTVELILDLLEFKAISGTPTYSYWHARCNTMLKPWTTAETNTMKKKWMSMAGRVNGIMTAYLALVDYPSNHFQCCVDPEVVCIDGIVLSVESRRIPNATPWIDSSPLRCRFRKRDDRLIVVLKPEQKEILKAYIRNGVYVEDLLTLAMDLSESFGSFLSQNYYVDPQNRYDQLNLEI